MPLTPILLALRLLLIGRPVPILAWRTVTFDSPQRGWAALCSRQQQPRKGPEPDASGKNGASRCDSFAKSGRILFSQQPEGRRKLRCAANGRLNFHFHESRWRDAQFKSQEKGYEYIMR